MGFNNDKTRDQFCTNSFGFNRDGFAADTDDKFNGTRVTRDVAA